MEKLAIRSEAPLDLNQWFEWVCSVSIRQLTIPNLLDHFGRYKLNCMRGAGKRTSTRKRKSMAGYSDRINPVSGVVCIPRFTQARHG